MQLIMSLLAVWWWLRSPHYDYNFFQIVYADGSNINLLCLLLCWCAARILQIYTVKCSNRRQTAFQVKDDRCKRSCTSLGFNP